VTEALAGRLQRRLADTQRRQRVPGLSAHLSYRVVSGRERGERLVVLREPDGRVRELRWAGYPFTREPSGFGGGGAL
jgi:hypothetical protein